MSVGPVLESTLQLPLLRKGKVRNQKALIWVSTAPLYGIGSFITTSNALIRSLATSKTVSSPAS